MGQPGRANDLSSAVGMFVRLSDGCVVARTMVRGFIFSATAYLRLHGGVAFGLVPSGTPEA